MAAHLEVVLENERDPFGYFATPSIRDRIARLAGDHARARRHLAEVSATTVPNRLPWGYLEAYGSELRYRAVRKRLGIP